MAYPRRRRRRSLSVGTTHHEHNSDNDKNEATAASARSLSPKRTRKAVSFSEEQPMVLETYSNDDYNRQIGEDPWYEMTPQERDEVRQQIWDYIHLEMPLNECYTSGRHKYCQLCWRNTCTCRIRAREMWRRRPGISASFVSCKYRPRPVSASSPRRRSPSFTLRRVDSSFG
ncbi:hypothetical protein EV182_001721 [Spiromyces aspiralis]|uniref:Uncharacterized protein n=1 Tax=Spiromyces aspiralis TaxID=68401 RepID=A0ACC1HSP7_9FUNG|nr:hypothetical protein EV182_001721 [Spiromyces aspiralis]